MPTDKRIKYLEKQASKLGQLRSKNERDMQIKIFIMQMHEYQIPFGDPDIQKLLKLFRTYIEEGETNIGNILVRGIDSYAYYRLFADKKRNCEVDIKKREVDKNQKKLA